MSIPRPAAARQAPDADEAATKAAPVMSEPEQPAVSPRMHHPAPRWRAAGPVEAATGQPPDLPLPEPPPGSGLAAAPRSALEQRGLAGLLDEHRFHAMRSQVAAALDQNSALGELVAATPTGAGAVLRTAVMTAQGDVALASRHGPGIAAIPSAPVHHVLRHYLDDPTVGVQAGDAFLFAEGGGQGAVAPAQGLLMPCLHDQQVVAWVACALHGVPAAGDPTGPGPACRDPAAGWPWEWCGSPPVKVAEGWQLKADLLALMHPHGQSSPPATANLHAWLATCIRLCESLHGQLEHHGAEQVAGMLRHSLERVADAVAARLEALPQATVRGAFYLEGTPQEAALIKLEVALTVQGRRCKVDLRGSAPEIANRGVNLPLAATRQCLLDTLVVRLWRDLANLPAVLHPFDFQADPGSLLACSERAPGDANARTQAVLTRAFSHLVGKLGALGPMAASGSAGLAGARLCAAAGLLRDVGCMDDCKRPPADGAHATEAATDLTDPLDRPPHLVLADLQRGALGAHRAWRVHGVVLDPSGLGVDLALTHAERGRRRKARIHTALRWQDALQRHAAPGPAQGVPFFGRWNAEVLIHAGLQRALPGQFARPVALLEPGHLPAAWACMREMQWLVEASPPPRPTRAEAFSAPLTLAAGGQLLRMAWQALRVASWIFWSARLSPRPRRALPRRLHRQHVVAQALCRAVSRLGPTVAKLARLAAARPDLLGSEVAAHLSLHPPPVTLLPPLYAMRMAERSLGGPLRELFLRFDTLPLATGVFSQIHGAVLHDGRRCAVKVKRPGVEPVLAAELGALSAIAAGLDRWPAVRARHAGLALGQMAQAIRAGADFRAEAARHARWAQELAGFEGLRMPQTVPEFCSDAVITLEHVKGLAPAAWLERHGGHDLAQAETIYRLGWRLQFSGHLLQAGPHAGHVLIDEAGRLVLLDTTLLSRIDAAASMQWLRACMAAIAGDAALWLQAATGGPADPSGHPQPARQLQALVAELQSCLDGWAAVRRRETALPWLGMSRLIERRGMVLPEPLQRAMAADIALAGLAQLFDPGFDAAGLFQRELPRLALEHGRLQPEDPYLLAATRRDLRPAIHAALAPVSTPPLPAASASPERMQRSSP